MGPGIGIGPGYTPPAAPAANATPDNAITDPNQADAVIYDDAQGDATTAVIVNDAE